MKRKHPSTSQEDFTCAKRHKLFWTSAVASRNASTSSGSEHGLEPLVGSTAPLLSVHHQNLISNRGDSGVAISTEVPPPAPDLLVEAHVERRVSSIQDTPASTELSPCSKRNPVHGSGVRRSPVAQRVGNARAYRRSFLSTASTGSQVRVEIQVPSIQATPTSTQLSPCSTRNTISSGSQSGVHRSPSARRVANARAYRRSFLSTASTGSQAPVEQQVSSIQATPTSTQLPPSSITNAVISGSESGVHRNPSTRRVGNARAFRLSFLSTASTDSQAPVERQVSSIQATPTSTQLPPSSITNPVISGSQPGVRQNSSALRFRLRPNPVHTSSNYLQYQNYPSQRQADSYRDLRMNIDDMSYEELLALQERIGIVNTGIEKPELSNFVKKVICCGEQDNAEQCVICMEQYNDGDEMGLLKCSHDYHFSCIGEWMKNQAICPICRSKATRF